MDLEEPSRISVSEIPEPLSNSDFNSKRHIQSTDPIMAPITSSCKCLEILKEKLDQDPLVLIKWAAANPIRM